MTPQGHMFAGWITFSATEVDDETVAQAQVLMRATDPIFEIGLTMGGHKQEDRFWQHTLTRAGRRTSAHEAEVDTQVVCVDKRRQWSQVAQRLALLRDPLDALHARRPGCAARLQAPPRGCLSRDDAVVVGAGPNGLAAAIALAPRRPLGAGARGGRHDRRRVALGGADAARLRPRRLLGRPPAGARLAVPARAAAGRARAGAGPARARRSRTRSTTAPRSRSSARSRRPRAIGGRGRRGVPAAMEPLVRDARRAAAARSSARCGRRATRSRWRASGCRRAALGAGLARPLRRASARARCSRAAPRTRCCRSTRRRPAPSGSCSCSAAHARRLAGGARRLAGGRRRAGRRSALARRRDRHRAAASSGSTSSPAPAPCCSTSPRARSSRSPATGCRTATAGALERYRYGPGVFKLDWALDGPIPWTAPECRARRHRAPRRHARGDRGLGGGGAAAGTPSGRSCCSPSRASSTRAARPAGKHTAWAYCHVPARLDRAT